MVIDGSLSLSLSLSLFSREFRAGWEGGMEAVVKFPLCSGVAATMMPPLKYQCTEQCTVHAVGNVL